MRFFCVVVSGLFAVVACGGGSDAPLFSDPAIYPGVRAVAVSGNHVYTADDRLHIYEITDTELTEVGTGASTTGAVTNMAVKANALYYADSAGIEIADISDPTSIVPAGKITGDFDGRAFTQLLAGGERFVASGNAPENLVTIWDFADPLAPAQYASIPFQFGYESLAVSGNLVIVAEGSDPNVAMGYVELWDITTPATPQKLPLVSGIGQPGLLFRFDDGLIYCGRNGAGTEGPTVLDVRDAAHPAFINAEAWKGVELFAPAGPSHVFTAVPQGQGIGGNHVVPWDTSDPYLPVQYGSVESTDGGLFASGGQCCTVNAMVADDNRVYAVNSGGLTIVGFSP